MLNRIYNWFFGSTEQINIPLVTFNEAMNDIDNQVKEKMGLLNTSVLNSLEQRDVDIAYQESFV